MKLNVVKNAKRNLLFGVVSNMVALLCPFATRTVIQCVLGAEYLGLNSLFSSIISVLNVSELGFSSAIVYCMYKPIAENDTKTVNALLGFYRKAYAMVGIIILGLGLCLVPFLDKLINGSYPNDINIIELYIIYLINTSISYFMYAYRSSLIVVYQREDINSVTNMIITVLLMVCQICALYITENYMIFALLMPIFTVANNLRIGIVVKRMFPQYKCEGHISKELFGELKKKLVGTLISKISNMSRNSFDSICISTFIGLAVTAMYNNYYYIIIAVASMMGIVLSSIKGGIGNHVVLKTKDENFDELKRLDFIYMNISGWCTSFILCLVQPFMYIWMGRDMVFPLDVVVLLCIYFYLLRIGDMRSIYTDTNGLWWEHRYRAITESVLNISLNILLAKYFGVYGVLVATILTIFLINQLWGSFITLKNYFGKEKYIEYWIYQAKYLFVTVGVCVVTYSICCLINMDEIFKTLCMKFMICIVIPGLLYFVIYGRTQYFKCVINIIFNRKQGNGI